MRPFAALAGLFLTAELAAWLLCEAAGRGLPPVAGLALCAVLAALAAWAGWRLVDRLALSPMRLAAAGVQALQAELTAEREAHAEQRRQLRHDLRGALSPAMLVADRLISNADPSVKRAGEMTVRAVERASELLSVGEVSPPGRR